MYYVLHAIFFCQILDDGAVMGNNVTLQVYFADVDTRGTGQVVYRLADNLSDLGPLQTIVEMVADGDNRFEGNYDTVFSVTWVEVGYFDQNTDLVSSFLSRNQ